MLRLKAFGGLALERDGVPVEGRVTQRRRLTLLAYLAAAGSTPSGRDKLIALFWPERDSEHGRHSLSQALYALRQELASDVVLGGIDEVRLNPAVLSSDVAEFRAALDTGELERAVSLYRGPFLDAVHLDDAPEVERWIDAERERLLGECCTALDRLAALASTQGDSSLAVSWRRRRLALTPLDVAATLRLMEALAASGDTAGAIRQARVHEELLRVELELGPDPEVLRLAERLRRSVSAAPAAAAPIASAPAVSPSHPDIATASRARVRFSRPLAWGGAAMLVLAAGLVSWSLQARKLRDGDRPLVLVGDFAGGDSTLALAIREAVLAELAAEPRIRLLTDGRVLHAKRLMRRAPEDPLDAPAAIELGRRVGAHFVVVGSIVPLGSGLQVVARVLEPGEGAVAVSVSERPARSEDIVAAVSRLGRSLRDRLVAVEPGSDPNPLPAVTTVSLQALEQYALARRALSRGDRPTALLFGEAALAEDSLFPLAHYLVGDLAWFLDQQSHSEAHLNRALALSGQAPLRERLLIRARHEQLVSDRPDSALAYWQLLRASHPEDVLAYEGMGWTLRALGRYREAAAVADSALRIDSTAVSPNVNNQFYSLMSLGDTAAAARYVSRLPASQRAPRRELRFLTALQRHDGMTALEEADSMSAGYGGPYRRHIALVALARIDQAGLVLPELEGTNSDQLIARHLILQGMAETTRDPARAAALGRRALARLSRADLSIPAIARLSERIGALGWWAGDRDIVEGARRLVLARDAGRGLRSYRIALASLNACGSLLSGNANAAAEQLATALAENYFGRSASTVSLLRADALAQLGDTAAARALYREVLDHAVPDTDFEAWPPLALVARRRLSGR